MGTTISISAGSVAATASQRWTVDRLRDHFQGELVRDPAAVGGAPPTRMEDMIREGGAWLWNKADWRFRWKRGTLTTADGTGTATTPSDFKKLAQRWLRDPQFDAGRKIQFMENPSLWEARANRWDLTDADQEAEPRWACVVQDPDESTFTWYFMLAPVPDAEYTYPFWYLRHDPFTLGDTDDDEVPDWPEEFDEGWYLRAKYKVFAGFSKSDVWKDYEKSFDKWLKDHLENNEETLATEVSQLMDVYGDLNRTAAAGLVMTADRRVLGGW